MYGSKAVGNGRIANALRQSAAKAKAEARAEAAARAAAKPKLTRWQPPDVQGEETKEAAKEALNFWAYEAEVRSLNRSSEFLFIAAISIILYDHSSNSLHAAKRTALAVIHFFSF
jgi:hypothetical protein